MILFEIFKNDPIIIIPWFFALLFALTIHEFAHGFAAYKLGDDTAAKMGRLTFNPLAHLDIFGSIMLLLVGFGWAKPVPINVYNLKKENLRKFIVSFAGVFFNIVFAFIFILILKFFIIGNFPIDNLLVKFISFLIYINIALFVFNLLPIPPLDGFHMIEYFFPSAFIKYSNFINQWGLFILIIIVFGTNIIGYLISWAVFIISWLFQINIFYYTWYGF